MESGALASRTLQVFFKSIVPPIVWKVTRFALNNARKKAIVHPYNGFSIMLPANHMFPTYQKNNSEYDKFLPYLAKYIPNTDCIIDIGANVGDTLAGMVEQNSSSDYICIEADEYFYKLLLENVNTIRDCHKDLRVQSMQYFVGQSLSNVKLEGKNGTKHAVLSLESGGIKSVKLDDLMKNVSYTKIGLLKTDVDGFDYDVLNSSLDIIKANSPVLYFELFFSNENQKMGYNETISTLADIGYCDWTVFDNFGAVVLRTIEVDVIFQLMNYVERQNLLLSTRTIHYFDVLAVQRNHLATVDLALRNYLSSENL
jgi:FkbM family methyltransferase